MLKKAYGRYNEIRINTIDKVLFPERIFLESSFIIKRDDFPFRLTTIKNKGSLDTRLQHQISLYENWTQDEYLIKYDSVCVIEPKYGWAISAENSLIYPSLGFSRASYLPKPSLKSLRMSNIDLPVHDVLISLRDTGEENYYHFYNDVIAKLFFLEEKLSLPFETPVLIAEALYKKNFFQYFLQHPYLKNRNWIVQKENEYIRCQTAYFCKPLTHTPHYYERIRQLVQPQDLAPIGIAERRIFITRSPKRLRFIENNVEIADICKRKGFEIVDFDGMTMPEQIYLLSQARYVVGIHGAGLVNMMFRGKKSMGLLEVFPPGEYYPFHYMLMANQLGYQYDGMVGNPGSTMYSGGFLVPVADFERRVEALVANAIATPNQ